MSISENRCFHFKLFSAGQHSVSKPPSKNVKYGILYYSQNEGAKDLGSRTNLLLFCEDITRISVQKRDNCSSLHDFFTALDELVVLAENRWRGMLK